MPANVNTYIIPPNLPTTLVSSATCNVDVRLTDIQDMKVFLTQTWPSGCSATTGLAVNLYPGTIVVPASAASYNGRDPNENPMDPIPKVISNPASQNNSSVYSFSTNYAPVTTLSGANAVNNPSGSAGAGATTNTMFYLNTMYNTWSPVVRMQIINLDAGKPVNISMLASI